MSVGNEGTGTCLHRIQAPTSTFFGLLDIHLSIQFYWVPMILYQAPHQKLENSSEQLKSLLLWATLHSRDMRQRVNKSVMSHVAISVWILQDKREPDGMERCLNWMVREGLLEKMEFEQRSEGSNERAIYFICAKIIPGKGRKHCEPPR